MILVLHIWCCVCEKKFHVMQWCSPQDQGLGLQVPRGQKWKFWSWSRRKRLAVFQDFCCNCWRPWSRHTMTFCERQQKQFSILNPLFERIFCVLCTSAPVESVFSHENYLLGHVTKMSDKLLCELALVKWNYLTKSWIPKYPWLF